MKTYDYFQKEKIKLINGLKSKGIKNEQVLNAVFRVPREKFLSEKLQENAYEDRALPIALNQTISQPYTVAFMTELLEVRHNEKVLEIGTGSGYQAAILCEMGADLYSVERIPELSVSAQKLLNNLGYNLKFFVQDGSLGLEEFAPYDKIIITAGTPNLPLNLLNQVNIGGKILAPVGDEDSQTMTLITKIDETKYSVTEHSKFKFVPLIGENAWNEKY